VEPVGPVSKQAVDISSAGRINGEEFEGRGSGTGDSGTGAWDFEVTFSRIPPDADAFAVLVGVLILPTVIFGREEDGTRNLLSLANGNVEFTQLTEGDQVAVQSRGSIKTTDEGRLSWLSRADGEIRMREVREVEPFDAVMLPLGAGKIADVLTFPFITSQGRQLVHAVRNITFSPSAELPGMQFRRIRIQPAVSAATVRVATRSMLRAADGKRTSAGRH
jgi:hypothetical protein